MMTENLQCWGWSYLLLPEGLEQLLRQSVFKNRVAAVEPDGVSRSVGYPLCLLDQFATHDFSVMP